MEGIRLEFGKLRRDARADARSSMRKLGARALPAAAVIAVATGGLCVRKQAYPPERKLDYASSFQCGSMTSRGLPSSSVVEGALKQEAGKYSLGALRRAAQRLRGPLERDVMNAERTIKAEGSAGDREGVRRSVYAKLVEGWREAGFLSEPIHRENQKFAKGIDIVTQIDESYGRDLGVEVPLCMLRAAQSPSGDVHSLAPEDCIMAADALQQNGVVRLRELVPASQIQELRDKFGVVISALDKKRQDARGFLPIRQFKASQLQELDPELEPVVSAPGRINFIIRGRPLEDAVRHLQAGALPLVWEHLARTAPGQRPYVSEVQIVVAEACAADQFWHVDNACGGLSLFVPLTSVPEDLGATLFLPGTQNLCDDSQGRIGRSLACASALLSSDGLAVGTLQVGDALLYDARTFHRCPQNRRLDRMRIGIMFRYDVEQPPGIGILGTQMVSWAGGLFSSFQRFYATLPGGAA